MRRRSRLLGTILAFVPSALLVAHITVWSKESAPDARVRNDVARGCNPSP
jgi:hypothetical protein